MIAPTETTVQDKTGQAAELVRRAHEKRLLFDVPGYEQAVPLLKEAVELDPHNAPAYAELSQTYAYWGFRREICGLEHQSLYDMALDYAQEALRLDARLPAAHRAIAVALRRGSQADCARREKEVDEALALAPDDPETLCEKWRVNGYNPEDPILERVLALSPGFVAVHIDLGAVLSELEQFQESLVELEKAVVLNPMNAQCYYDIAMVLDRMGLRDKAVKLLKKAQRLRPDDALIAEGVSFLESS